MSELVLQIGSQRHTGWKAVGVRRSLETAASQFELELTDKWSDQVIKPITKGSACTVSIDGDRVITGYVDEVLPEYDAKQRVIRVIGRSKVADLVDCSDVTKTFKHRTLPEVALALCKPFDINVVDQVGITTRRANKTIDQGQAFFEFLEEWARSEGVRLTDNPAGDLVITRAGSQRVETALILGENLLRAAGRFSARERYSRYVIQAQQGWGENTTDEAATHIQGIAADIRLRFRPILLTSESSSDSGEAKQRAAAQRNVDYGRSNSITYTVRGWRHDSALWSQNTLIRIVDHFMGVTDKWWLVGEVEYTLDEDGELSRLIISPKEAYDVVPLPAEESGGWGA